MNFFYVTDENYCIHTGVSITSLLENNKEQEKITIYILLHQVLKASREKLLSLEKQYKNAKFIFITSEALIERIQKEHITLAKYRRNITANFLLFIEWILPEELQKIVCIDSDTIVLGSVWKLWNTNIEQYVLGGVHDWSYALEPDFPYSKKILDQTYDSLKKTIYFNTGVLLVNLDNLRKMHLTEKFVYLLNQHKGEEFLPDQDILNYAVEDRYVRHLPPRYNYWSDLPVWALYRNARLMGNFSWHGFCEEKKNAVIIHFILNPTAQKPWDSEASGVGKRLYLKYRRLTPWKDEKLKAIWSRHKIEKMSRAFRVYLRVWIGPRWMWKMHLKICSILKLSVFTR